MNDKLKIPYGYNFSCYIDEDEYIDFVYENGTEDKIIWREYKKDIVVIKEPSKQELQQKINKAVAYIDQVKYRRDDQIFVDILHPYLDKLLEVLKGSDK